MAITVTLTGQVHLEVEIKDATSLKDAILKAHQRHSGKRPGVVFLRVDGAEDDTGTEEVAGFCEGCGNPCLVSEDCPGLEDYYMCGECLRCPGWVDDTDPSEYSPMLDLGDLS